MRTLSWGSLVLFAVVGIGCYGAADGTMNASAGAGGAGTASDPGAANGPSAGPSGLPCDVQQLLASRCTSCHADPPVANAPMGLATYDDLTAPAKSDPTKKVVELCVARMQSTTSPMPPAPASRATAAEVATLQSWIQAGLPRGACDAGAGGADPYATPLTCTSGTHWTSGDRGSSRMHPGGACIQCHASNDGPSFYVAGTVFPTAHEPIDCNGTSGATVVIVDATGATFSLPTNTAGNFYARQAITPPYHAKVVLNGKERAMSAAQTSGDCNSCHTDSGANGAPGRIMAP